MFIFSLLCRVLDRHPSVGQAARFLLHKLRMQTSSTRRGGASGSDQYSLDRMSDDDDDDDGGARAMMRMRRNPTPITANLLASALAAVGATVCNQSHQFPLETTILLFVALLSMFCVVAG